MAYDFTNTVLDRFIADYKTYFTMNLDPSDPLHQLEVTLGPLQDDPTKRSPYLVIEPDKTLMDLNSHWRVPVTAIKRGMLPANQDFPAYEVGGQFLYINFFLMQGWLPKQATREQANDLGGRALRSIEMGFSRMMYMMTISEPIKTDDENETSEVPYPQALNNDGAHYEIIGGNTTWYPKMFLRFHIFSGVSRDFMLGF